MALTDPVSGGGVLSGRAALVTGGTAGIGEATVREFLRHGARVVFSGTRAEAGERLVGELASCHGPDAVRFERADVADPEQVGSMVAATLAAFGRIDILFNNAGTGCFGRTPDLDAAEWRRVLAVDLDGVFHCCKAVIPAMRRQGEGVIVNNASVSGLAGDYSFTAYAAAKGGVINYTRALALDHARDNIRVNAVCPGLIATEMIRHTMNHDALRQACEANIPMGRIGRVEEVARLVRFLASDDASYMTGALVPVDGGITAWSGQPDIARILGIP